MFYEIYIYPSQEKTLEVSADITNQNKSTEGNEIKISKAEKLAENYVENIIQNQIEQGIKTELVQTEETLEYLTQYRTNIKITNKTKIIWTSSNTNIVSTNKHKITAHHKGLAIITLTIKDRTVCKKAICTIRVT